MSDILFPFHSKFLTPDGDISRPWLLWLQNPQVLTISTQSPSTVANGGTGLSSTPISGQLLIGNGTGYSLNTLSASGITVTNGAGTIALSLNTFSPSSYGGVPASGGGTANFLRADGTWATPVGGGSAGPAGPIGPPGFDGNDGEDGQQGFPGPQGQPGTSGATGAVGPMGMMGEDGADGDAGPPGLAGSAGQAGATGARGQIGPAGEDGSDAEAFFIGIPTPQAAGATTQIQYNNAGAFGANANFFYTSGTNTVSFGSIIGSELFMRIQAKVPTVLETPGTLSILGGNATKANTNGGGISIIAGAGSGTASGGGLFFASGSNVLGNGLGGEVNFSAGDGVTNGGNFSFQAGGASGIGGFAGSVIIQGGLAYNSGGTGGDFIFLPGAGVARNGLFGVQPQTGTTYCFQGGDNSPAGSDTVIRFFAVGDGSDLVKQQTTSITSAGLTPGTTVGIFHTDDKYGGYTIGQIVTALKAYGLLA